jgi:hypothetical protein
MGLPPKIRNTPIGSIVSKFAALIVTLIPTRVIETFPRRGVHWETSAGENAHNPSKEFGGGGGGGGVTGSSPAALRHVKPPVELKPVTK